MRHHLTAAGQIACICGAFRQLLWLLLMQIRQVSAQVHDIEGRVKQLCKMLEQKGFQIEIYQEPRFVECNLHMVYGFRPGSQ